MFIGHIALAFAAKRVTPRVSLAMLLLASQWADTLWPVLLLLGMERVRIEPSAPPFMTLEFISYPYSHSLLMLVVWGVVVGGAYRGIVGGRRTVWVLSALVVSHWVLDYVTHRPDMPLYPGGPGLGLGLWRSVPLTMAVETIMYAMGLWVYMRCTRPADAVGKWGFVTLALLLMILYIASTFGAPPPSERILAITAIVGAALFTAWAWWVDRHREMRSAN
jgi:hypothetical protein